MREMIEEYPFEIRPLTEKEGGGFLISYPDFNVCIADGETIDEAIANGKEALTETIAALKEGGFPVPAPNSGGVASGKFIARVPKSLHAQMTARAKAEGVSFNALVISFLSAGMAR